MSKVVLIEKAKAKFADSQTLLIGGFLTTGTPESLVDALVETAVKNLTVISNDTGYPEKGIGKLVAKKQLKKVIVSHVGTNPETGRQMHAQEMEVNLVPQGTLAERIRCGGAGLGGFFTPTGVGTIVAEGKEQKIIGDKTYLLELPLRGDIALLKAWKADEYGNLVFRKAARNFNPLMAMAADFVIVEAEEIVPTGAIDPDEVMITGAVVNMIIQG